MELTPRSKLLAQLSVVDRAIEKLVHDEETKRPSVSANSDRSPIRPRSVLGSAATSLFSSVSEKRTTEIDVGPDQSNKILTKGIQPAICEYCGEEVDIRLLDSHKQKDCKNRLVPCPNSECGLIVHYQSMKWHLQNECIVTTMRSSLLEKKRERELKKAAEEAEREAFLSHTSAMKSLRSIEQMQTVVDTTQERPPTSPSPTIKMVLCADCSEQMRESHLPHHLASECAYRRIMCPNYGFGCQEKEIPLNQIQFHLRKDCKAEIQRKLMMENSKLRMEKIQCSTCGEFVMLKDWRRHEEELCENRLVPCKNHLFGCQVMIPMKERAFHELIDESYARHGIHFNGLGSHLYINENDIVNPWTVELWLFRPSAHETMKMHITNLLLQLPAYFLAYAVECSIKDKVLDYVRSLKEDVSKSKEEQAAFAKLSKAERTVWQNEKLQQRMHRVNELTALIPTYSDAALSYLHAFQTLAISIEAGLHSSTEWRLDAKQSKEPQAEPIFSLQSDYPGLLGAEGPTIARPSSSMGGGADDQSSADQSASNLSQLSSDTSATLDASRIAARLQVYSSTNSAVAKYFERCFYTESLKAIQAMEAAMKEAAAKEREGEKVDASPRSANQEGDDGDDDAEHQNGDDNDEEKVGREDVGEQGEEEMKNGEATEVKKDSAVTNEEDAEDALFDEIFKDITVPGEKPPPIEAVWTRFLFDFAIHPRRAMQEHSFSLTQWQGLLQDMANALRKDFDQLQDWRVEAGLLSPDVKGSSSSKRKGSRKESTKVNLDGLELPSESTKDKDAEEKVGGDVLDEDKKDKAARKREKDRQRRELKKLRNQEAEEAASASNKATESGDGQSGKDNKGMTTDSKKKSSKEVKFLSRSTELFRAGCGAEILMDATTVNSQGNRSRICMAMFSGLSLLDTPLTEEDVEVVNHHYDLIIPIKEMSKLMAFRGQLGVVSAATDGSAITEVLGSQAMSFGTRIPRNRWVHLAIVATKQKMTLYIDGKALTSLKDGSIPLPMGSLGGTPHSLSSFRGVVLDARYWDHQRSGQQVLHFMNRLIDVETNKGSSIRALEESQSRVTSSASGSRTHKQVNKKKKKAKKREDDGLIAWWTFEDGPGHQHVTDITRHRFKTKLSNSLSFAIHLMAGPAEKYPIPSLYLLEVPSGLHSLLPAPFLRDSGFKEWISDDNSNPEANKRHRLDILRYWLSKWHWIQVETIACVEVKSAAPIVAPSGPSTAKDKPKHKEKDKNKSSASSSHNKPPGKLSHLPDYLWNEEMMDAGSNLPIPSYRESNLCPFEIRRLKLAKLGRRLHETLQCPLGCGQEIRVMSKRHHQRFECPRRFMRCRYDFCGSLFPVEDQEHHERYDCALIQQREKWLRRGEAKNQQVHCYLCNEAITIRDLPQHLADECEQRLIFCPYADCAFGMAPHRPGSPSRRAVEENKPAAAALEVSSSLSHSSQDVKEEVAGEAKTAAEESKVKNIEPQLPAHRLAHHLRFDCTSLRRKTLFLWVERARERHPYPRPWGLVVDLPTTSNTNATLDEPNDNRDSFSTS